MLDLWILTHRRVGDLQQMRTLASTLEARAIEKQIRFRNARLARALPFLSVLLMDEAESSPLTPPWPELVLVAEGAVGSIALEVRRRSGGKTKTVCLGRPRGRMSEFDLIITTPQFGLASAPNVLELTLPLHRLDRPAMERAAASLLPQLSHLPRPWTVLLVGGTSPPDILDEAGASVLAKHALGRARQQGASLLVVTSPRTGESAEHSVAQTLGSNAHIFRWSQVTARSDYLGYLHLADNFIVTSDSVSMITEALLTGKPVEVYRLPQQLTLLQRLVAWIGDRDPDRGTRGLFNLGVVEGKADRRRFLEYLEKNGCLGAGRLRGQEASASIAAAKTKVLELLLAQGTVHCRPDGTK
jgi:mitochondrial fission protein ELM1